MQTRRTEQSFELQNRQALWEYNYEMQRRVCSSCIFGSGFLTGLASKRIRRLLIELLIRADCPTTLDFLWEYRLTTFNKHMSKHEEIAFLKVLASMQAQRKLLSSSFRKELVRIYAGETTVRLPRQGIWVWWINLLAHPAGAIPVSQGEKGVHILPPSTPDACSKARSKAPGQLSEAESPALPAAAKGINPSLSQAVSLACSIGKRVAMFVRLHGLPEAGATNVTIVARRASCPQTSLVGRSRPQPTNHASRTSSRTPDDVRGCRKRQLQPFPIARCRSPWGATKRNHVYVSDATPGTNLWVVAGTFQWPLRWSTEGIFIDPVLTTSGPWAVVRWWVFTPHYLRIDAFAYRWRTWDCAYRHPTFGTSWKPRVFMGLFSRRCDRSVKKNHSPTANFVVSVARGSEVPWRVLSPSSPVRD